MTDTEKTMRQIIIALSTFICCAVGCVTRQSSSLDDEIERTHEMIRIRREDMRQLQQNLGDMRPELVNVSNHNLQTKAESASREAYPLTQRLEDAKMTLSILERQISALKAELQTYERFYTTDSFGR